jgi:hypothetical protein
MTNGSGVDSFVALLFGATRMSIVGRSPDQLPSRVGDVRVAHLSLSDMNVAD